MSTRILPGATIGVFGSGTSGRAISAAALALGYHVRVFDADHECRADSLAVRSAMDPVTYAAAAVAALAGCDVVTAAVEHVSPNALAAIARAGTPVRPSPALLAVAQDRVREREWLAARRVPLASWRAVDTLDEAVAALAALDRPCVLKPALRRDRAAGVLAVRTRAELEAAWAAFGGVRCALEEALEIDAELSVLVARGLDGTTAVYPPSRSQRVDYAGTPRLLWSVLPDGGARQHAAKARRLAGMVAERLHVEGLLAVEMFLLSDGRLVVNELVPCAHPTFLPAEQACGAGQYEQLVRAICGLPLGATTIVRPVAVAPIYADAWIAGAASRTHAALRMPGVTMRAEDVCSDEADSRVAHLAASGDTPDEAIALVLRARPRLADADIGKAVRPSSDDVRHPGASSHTTV